LYAALSGSSPGYNQSRAVAPEHAVMCRALSGRIVAEPGPPAQSMFEFEDDELEGRYREDDHERRH
jgi:hypothetical protein